MRHKTKSFSEAKPGVFYRWEKKDGQYYWIETKKKGNGAVILNPVATTRVTTTIVVPARVSKFSTNDPKAIGRRLIITDEAMHELAMWSFAVGNASELNGLGLVSSDDDGNITLERVFMCSKDANSGSVGLDEAKQAAAIASVMAEGRSSRDLRLYWHFHTGGRKTSAFWSVMDEQAIEDELDWSDGAEVINLVMSQLPSMKARVDKMENDRIVSEGLAIEIGEVYEQYKSAAEQAMGSPIFSGQQTGATVCYPYRGWSPGLDDGGKSGNDGGWEWGGWDIEDLYAGLDRDEVIDDKGDWSPEADRWLLGRGVCPDCIEDLYWDGVWAACPSCGRQWDGALRQRQSGASEHTSIVLHRSPGWATKGHSPV